jgi:hypothetical protein
MGILDRFEDVKEDGEYNPIVMVEIPKNNLRSVNVRAHRLKFMCQNLDGNTGDSPLTFAKTTKQYAESNGDKPRLIRIYVRSDDWWKNQSSAVMVIQGSIAVTVQS